MSSSTVTFVRVSFVICVFAVLGYANAVSMPPENGATATGSGYATVVWSILEDCFDVDSTEPVTVCLKSKALTALDRALSKPTVTVADGIALAARAGKSLPVDQQAEKADRAALDAAKDPIHKNDLLDDMLAIRMNRLMSTRTIIFDEPEGQEGRKKKDKAVQQALMMAGMTAAAVMGPLALKMIALIAGKALLISKVALVLSALIALKKLIQPQQSGHESSHETVSYHHGRSIRLDARDMAYSAQKQ